MKVVVSGHHDWIVYLVMFALSAAVHTGVVFLVFMLEPAAPVPAVEGQLVAPGEAPDGAGPSVQDALTTWRSRLSGREEDMKTELSAKLRTIDEQRPADAEPWSQQNSAARLRSYAELAGLRLRDVRLEKSEGASGKLDFQLELQSDAASVLPDLALLTHLVGQATQKRSFPTDKLVVDVYGPDEQLAGRFELGTQASRDLAAGHMTLRELFQEGLRSI